MFPEININGKTSKGKVSSESSTGANTYLYFLRDHSSKLRKKGMRYAERVNIRMDRI